MCRTKSFSACRLWWHSRGYVGGAWDDSSGRRHVHSLAWQLCIKQVVSVATQGAVTLMTVIACSHRRHGQDKTRLSCLVRVGGVNTTADKTRQFCFVSTQFPISRFSVILNKAYIWDWTLKTGSRLERTHRNWVKTKQNCLVLSAIMCSHRRHGQDKTRQFCLVRVGDVNKL